MAGELEERGLIEDCGRSQFGAILYRTSSLFQRLFGLSSHEVPPPEQPSWITHLAANGAGLCSLRRR